MKDSYYFHFNKMKRFVKPTILIPDDLVPTCPFCKKFLKKSKMAPDKYVCKKCNHTFEIKDTLLKIVARTRLDATKNKGKSIYTKEMFKTDVNEFEKNMVQMSNLF